MSIGSETIGNVEAVEVRDLTIDGADNGTRIKSNSTRGGFVRKVVYKDVCIRDTKNPIVIDPFYSTERGTLVPNFDDVTIRSVRVLTPGKITLLGTDDYHRSRLHFDGVRVDGYDPKHLRAEHARISIGPGGLSFLPVGEDVEVNGQPGQASAPSCEGRFESFPAEPETTISASPRSAVTVSLDGSGNFTSVQQGDRSITR